MKAGITALAIALTIPLFAVEEQPESKTVTFSDATDTPVTPLATGPVRRRLTDREARKLGATIGGVRAALKDLKASGAIDGTESTSELAVIVADYLSTKKEYSGAYKAVDWDALLAFLEKLIALITRLFAP